MPIQCVTKKCKLSVSSSCVEFRPACVGETRRRTFQLKNEGALGTRYVIKQISDVDSSGMHFHCKSVVSVTIYILVNMSIGLSLNLFFVVCVLHLTFHCS